MLKDSTTLIKIVVVLVLLRIFSIVYFPYADTTEPRYAEIARIMATSGDWITPWFEPDKPFWGKPPLSFWFQALSINAFGVEEWTARFPSLIVTLLTVWVIFKCAIEYAGSRAAYWAVAIYATCALPYASAGAVLTDPYLALGTVLCMAGLLFPSVSWRIAGFIGLAIGLLSKGPLALVLVLGPIVMSLLVFRTKFWPPVQKPILLMGSLLVVALVLPWYVLAEIKTPGFLDYFIVGEHFRRYVDPGWAGDIYGSAHVKPYGSIWPLWIEATFPWGIVAIIAAVNVFIKGRAKLYLENITKDPVTFYYLSWAIFSMVFFTFAGNILWTYILPAIPPFAILFGKKLSEWSNTSNNTITSIMGVWFSIFAVPLGIFIATMSVSENPYLVKTEKMLIEYPKVIGLGYQDLWYIDERPFSARYYSNGSVKLINVDDFDQMLKLHPYDELFLAVPFGIVFDFQEKHLDEKGIKWEYVTRGHSKRFELLHIHKTQVPGKLHHPL